MGEDEGVGRSSPKALCDPVGPVEGLGRALPPGGAVGKKVPPRTVLSDLRRGEPFVVPIVPLEKVGVEGDPVSKAGKLGRLPGPKKRARQDRPGRKPLQKRGEGLGLFDPELGQGEIGAAGMAARFGPEGRPVADKDNGHGRRSPFLRGSHFLFSNELRLSDFGKNIERGIGHVLRVFDGI